MRVGAIATIILAAGGSRRLGQPKQLVHFKGRTLLRRAAEIALDARLGAVWAVVGADAERLQRELTGLDVAVAPNPGWSEGLGSSIRVGVQHARVAAPSSILLMVCDQLTLTAQHLRALAEQQSASGRPIAASRYGESLGVPALFRAEVFDELSELRGDAGAKRLIERAPNRVVSVPLDGGDADVDTPRDLQRLAPPHPDRR